MESISSPAVQTSNELQALLDVCAEMLSAISQQRDDSKSLGENNFGSNGMEVALMDILLNHKLAARSDDGDLEVTDKGSQFLEEYMLLSSVLE